MQNSILSRKSLVPKRLGSFSGLIMASIVLLLWLTSLILLLRINIAQIPLILIIFAVLGRTFLQTGLFITAHDAMHGTVYPKNRILNDGIGIISTRSYALLSYKRLLKKHQLHHRYPASPKDPDFCKQGENNPFIWYFRFMKGYLEGEQSWVLLIGMALIFGVFKWGFNIPASNLFLFWVLPIFISSIQLFCFGIFLPHRRPKGGYQNRHRARSIYYPTFLSLITCYHFGYHWEHHEFPHLPWYKLPSVVKK